MPHALHHSPRHFTPHYVSIVIRRPAPADVHAPDVDGLRHEADTPSSPDELSAAGVPER
ncbi:hypothetical protein PAN31117_00165 [Pandoraea anapnoica]|uniref:Uncharacterized protein n=1 Tax=Pandoraea anapnoica TaxID=2508301 RepID=A0A5E4ZFV4_9BURK|nr:hypothetical protein [Pandoraea anapnoica]VVE60209.1 hypothetical protein PAN31117_00165 [Pandoraea anapnoica]